MRKKIDLTVLLIIISVLSFGQINNPEEIKKKDLQRKAISSDSSRASILAKELIKSNLGNFIKNDTIYYPNKTVLRTSEASNGYLNGMLIYYNEKGGIYIKSKYKNGELCDTTFYYNMDGSLIMMQAYFDDRRTSVYNYYNSGEMKNLSKIKMVDLSPDELKKNSSQHTYKSVTESEQYFDKSGKEISFGEYLEIIKADSQKKSSDLSVVKTNAVNPSFPGGEKAMIKFLQKNLIYPASEKKKGITGTSYILFTIEKGLSTAK